MVTIAKVRNPYWYANNWYEVLCDEIDGRDEDSLDKLRDKNWRVYDKAFSVGFTEGMHAAYGDMASKLEQE